MRKRKLKIYLSGPMTGVEDLNRPLFNQIAKELRSQGYKLVNPPELDKNEPQRSWEGCLKRDIRYLLQCDAVANLPRWQKSRGATLENYIARQLKYEIHPYQYFLK